MYFRGWIHSWTCGDCPDAEAYWRLRAFWSGYHDRGFIVPSRCPYRLIAVWRDMWVLGHDFNVEQYETLGV